MQKLIGLGGNALIAISLLKKKNYVTTLGECNAVISRAGLQIENCDALAASRLITLLNYGCL